MTAAWPATVPQWHLHTSYSERPQRNVASFQPDSGIAIERRRSSVSTDDMAYDLALDSTQYDALLTFYRDTLKDGTLPFTRQHPRTGEDITCKFTEAPALAAVLVGHYRVTIRLVRLP